MNLVGTLGKMLLSNAMRRGGGGNLLGSLLGGALGGGAGAPGGLGGGLGGGMGGGANAGLGGLLAGLAGSGGAAGGGLGGLLGGAMGGGGQGNRGGLGSLLGGMLGGSPSQGGGLGSLLGMALGQQRPDGSAGQAPDVSPEQNEQAELLIRAMINSAKADGHIDDDERHKILGKLGEVDDEEAAFVRDEMAQPLDVDAFARSVPQPLARQVYLVSLLAIDLDQQSEARYLDSLRRGLGIDEKTANELHVEVGAQALYA